MDDRVAASACTSTTAGTAANNPANVGPWTQVSRLGNPLFNEVLVPMERKDDWNQDPPTNDSEYADGVLHPELAKLLPGALPGRVPEPGRRS